MASIFCYYEDMTKKDLIETKKQTSSQSGESFLVQSNIDDMIEENQNVENEKVSQSGTENKQDENPSQPADSKLSVSEAEKNENIDAQKKKIDEVEQSVSKKNSKKSKIINIVFFIVNIFVVAGILTFQLLKEEFTPLSGLRMDFSYLLVVALLLVLVLVGDTFSISYLLKQSTGKWKPGLSFKVAQIGRYYDDITPLAAGGQPFQITYLKSRGMPLQTSLSVPLAKYIFGEIAWVIVSFTCLVVSWVDTSYGAFVSIASIIGFVLNFAVVATTIFLSTCKTVGKKLVVKILKLLYKMKIIKNYDKQYEKITKHISDYQDVMKQYAKSPKDLIMMVLTNVLKLVIKYSMPFFITKFLAPGTDWSMYFKLFVMSCLVDVSSSFFPLPAGAGMAEISFAAAFGAVVGQTDVLVWVLLLWRFCTYYFYLLQGICIISYDMAYGNRKYKWQVRKNYLAEESAAFKQEQINRFRTARAKRRKIKN